MEDPPVRKTATRSFRVDESALESIEKDAAEASVSVNTFVNQLFLNYANFDRHFRKFDGVKVFGGEAEVVIESLTDEAAAKAGEHNAQNAGKGVILAKHGSLTLGTILEYLKEISQYEGPFTYYESETGGKRTVTLVHNWGSKSSTYWAHYTATLFDMVGLNPKITTAEESVTISF